MTGVSDFSAKVSRHVSQRLHTSIAPLSEANLYRHTITSPPSQDAKMKHILGYVELQRELIALEEDLYRSVTDKSHWNNTTNTNTNNIELHNSPLAPHNKNTQYPDDETIDQFDLLQSQSLPQPHQQSAALLHRRSLTGSYHQRKNSSPNPYTPQQQQQRRTPPPLSSPALYIQQHHQLKQQQTTTGTNVQQRHLNNIPDGLDPTMALPRALPRTKMTHHDQTLYRDSFYSGIGQETDWRQLEELDPDTLAGIHLYGDTSDLQPHAASQQQLQQQQQQQQPSPAAASSPLNKYPTYEFTPDPAPRNSDWQHEKHLQQLQQQAILKQLQYLDDEDKDDEGEAKVQMATRLHRGQHSIAQAHQLQFEQQHQQHQRQLVSPPPTSIEKERKAGRFSSRFSFLIRRRQQSQPQPQHQRSDSMPNASKEPWLDDFGNKSGGFDRFNTLGHRPRSGNQLVVTTAGARGASPLPLSRSGGPGATTPVDEEQEQFQEEGFSVKNKSRVKQMFRDVFGITKKKCQSPDLAFRDISLPSTHIRSSATPAHQHQQLYGHPQHLDPSINSQYQYSSVVAQRKGLITPVSRPDTAQSNYRNGNDNTSNNRNPNNNSNNKSRARESLVDPVQQLGFQKMEFDEDSDLLGDCGAFPEGHHPYGQTSLTPPPASSVLRHSTSPHRSFLSGSAEYEPVLITAAAANSIPQQQQFQGGAVVGGRTNRTTCPPLQVINTTLTPKDCVDSGCDSAGGLDQPYTTTASNATTLNQHHTTNTTATATIKGGSIYSQQPQQSQQPYLYSSPQAAIAATAGGGGGGQHQKSHSYDYDRAMTMSTYDNGPTIVSMAQVQKVDLEGLRQSHGQFSPQHHHHQTPPSHSHHLGMVPVEVPFA